MKSARLFVAAALALVSTSLPSHAYNHNVRDHFYHAPIEVQITDAAPRVEDKRTVETPGPTYVIEAPQKQMPASPVVSLAPAGGGSYIPNIRTVGPNLAPAGFRSAINPGPRGGMLKSLPNGTIIGHLGVQGQVKNPNNAQPILTSKAHNAVRQSMPSQPPAVLSYAPVQSTSGGSSVQVATNVNAQLAMPPRGSILHSSLH